MSNVDAINLSGDEGADEIGNVLVQPTVQPNVAYGSNAAKAKTHRKLKPNTGITKKRQRKLTSPVWEYFKILDDTDENGNLVCLCNRCGAKYIAESRHGTGNMLRHGKSCKGHTYKDVGQFILKTGLNGSLGTRASTYKHEEFRELLAIGGRVLDAYRSSLKGETAEMLVCLRDWVFNQSSLQPEIEELCKKVVKMDVNDVEDKDEIYRLNGLDGSCRVGLGGFEWLGGLDGSCRVDTILVESCSCRILQPV
ncbi:hypothetical protein LXL04_024233 [Taraxacum kok-saghyz]